MFIKRINLSLLILRNRTPRFLLYPLMCIVIGTIFSCQKDKVSEHIPIIHSFTPKSGIIGSSVRIYGDQFAPTFAPAEGTGPHTNPAVVAFNGIIASADRLYQEEVDVQRINSLVPQGATTGFITVTFEGVVASSAEEFLVTKPDYLPNVTVSTVSMEDRVDGIDIDIDNMGNLYVADRHYRIVKVSPDGRSQILWSSLDSTKHLLPSGIAIDSAGNVFASVPHYIIKIRPDGIITRVAGATERGFADGPGSNARFNFPWGLELDKAGNILVCDLLNHKIRKITPDGVVSTFAGSTSGFTDGQGINAQLGGPTDLTIADDGTIFVSDGGIRAISRDGFVSTIVGFTQGYLDGPTSVAQFQAPRGIAVDDSGRIYVCDHSNHVVRRIDLQGNVKTVAGSLFGNEDGEGARAKFGQTKGLTMDTDGAFYLTQGGGIGMIRKIVVE